MKTSYTELIKAENYLQQKLAPQDRLVFEAKLLVNEELRRNTFCHRMVHRLALIYWRRKLKEEARDVHERLFNDPAENSLRQIRNLFNR